MGDVIDLRQRRMDRLVHDLVRRLRDSDGTVSESVEDLSVDVETWRQAARSAGRVLGWSIRTRVRGGTVSLVDNRPDHQRSPDSAGPMPRAARTRELPTGDHDDG